MERIFSTSDNPINQHVEQLLAKDELSVLSGERTMVHTSSGDTYAVDNMASAAYIEIGAIALGVVKNTWTAPQRPLPEALPGHAVDAGFTQLELRVAHIAFKRLEWHTAKNGVSVVKLVAWLVQPDFSEHAAVVLVERLHRRGILKATGNSQTPWVTLSEDTTGQSLLGTHVQIKQAEAPKA